VFEYGLLTYTTTVSASDLITILVAKDVVTLLVNSAVQGTPYDILPGEIGPYYAQLTSSALNATQAIVDYSFELVPIRWWTVTGFVKNNWVLSKVGALHTNGDPAAAVWYKPYTFRRQYTFTPTITTYGTLQVGLTSDASRTGTSALNGVNIRFANIGGVARVSCDAGPGYLYTKGEQFTIRYDEYAVITVFKGDMVIASIQTSGQLLSFYVVSAGVGEGISLFSFGPTTSQMFIPDLSERTSFWSLGSNSAILTTSERASTAHTTETIVYPYTEFSISVGSPINQSTRAFLTNSNGTKIVGANYTSDGAGNLTIVSSYLSARTDTFTVSYSRNLKGFFGVSGSFVIGGTLSGGNLLRQYLVTRIAPASTPLSIGLFSGGRGTGIYNVLFNSDSSKGPPFWQALTNTLSYWILTGTSAILKDAVDESSVRTVDAIPYSYVEFSVSKDNTYSPNFYLGLTQNSGGNASFYATFDNTPGQSGFVRAALQTPGGSASYDYRYAPGQITFMQLSSGFTLMGTLSGASSVGEVRVPYSISNETYFFLDAEGEKDGITNLLFNEDASKNHINYRGVWTASYGVTNIASNWSIQLTSPYRVLGNTTVADSEIYTISSYPIGTTFEMSGISGFTTASNKALMAGLVDYSVTSRPNVQFFSNTISVGGTTYSNMVLSNLKVYTTASYSPYVDAYLYRTRIIDTTKGVVLVDDYDFSGTYSGGNVNAAIRACSNSGLGDFTLTTNPTPFFNTIQGWGDTWGWTVSSNGIRSDISFDSSVTTASNRIFKPILGASATFFYDYVVVNNSYTPGITDSNHLTVGFASSGNVFTTGPYITICLDTVGGTYTFVGYDQNDLPKYQWSFVPTVNENLQLIWYNASVGFATVNKTTGYVTNFADIEVPPSTYDSVFVQASSTKMFNYTVSKQEATSIAYPSFTLDPTDNQDNTWTNQCSVTVPRVPPGLTVTSYTIGDGTTSYTLNMSGQYNGSSDIDFTVTSTYPTTFTYTLTAYYKDIFGVEQTNVATSSVTQPPPFPGNLIAISSPGPNQLYISWDAIQNWFNAINSYNDGTVTSSQPYVSSSPQNYDDTFTYDPSKSGKPVTLTLTITYYDYNNGLNSATFTVPTTIP